MPRASAHGGMLIDRRESQLLATPLESLRGRKDVLLREASIGRPEKRCAVRLSAAPAAVRVCRGIRARKSGNELTGSSALLAHQTAATTHSAAFFDLSPSGGLHASLRKTSSRPDAGFGLSCAVLKPVLARLCQISPGQKTAAPANICERRDSSGSREMASQRRNPRQVTDQCCPN